MSEERFRFEKECTKNFFTDKGVFYNNERPMSANEIIALLNSLSEENEQLKQSNDRFADTVAKQVSLLIELRKENEQLRMKLKGDDYIMVSEILSNLRKTGICDDCKNKDKPVEWYLERGFSITGQICDRYEPE